MSTFVISMLVVGFVGVALVMWMVLHLVTLYDAPESPRPMEIVVGGIAFLVLGLPMLIVRAVWASAKELILTVRQVLRARASAGHARRP